MSELSKSCGRTANRLFFGSFFSPEKKEHVPLVPHYGICFTLPIPARILRRYQRMRSLRRRAFTASE